jgi:hypothetical protein
MVLFYLSCIAPTLIPISLISLTEGNDEKYFYLALFNFFLFTEIIFNWFGRYRVRQDMLKFYIFGINLFNLNIRKIKTYKASYFKGFGTAKFYTYYGFYFRSLEIITNSGWGHILPRANFREIQFETALSKDSNS